MSKIYNHTGKNQSIQRTPKKFQKGDVGGLTPINGLFLGIVRDIKDDKYQGEIFVELFEGMTPPSEDTGVYYKVRRAMPFGGTSHADNYSISFGMSSQPPTPGSEVLVGFTGNEQEGILLGVLPDNNRNAQVPGIPAGELQGEDGIGSTLENDVFNKHTGNARPRHPNANSIAKQGLGVDAVRGLSSSGMRRESPTNVTGFSTAGGHSFVMDDGTTNSDKNLTPDENRQAGSNKLVRFRSSGGGQILFNDSHGIVYIINQDGTSWVQMSADGKIDIYSESDISMHAATDFNLYVGGEFNLDADAINVKARGTDGIKFEASTGEFNLHSNKDLKLTTDLNGHIKAAGFTRMTTDGLLDLNGPPATAATKTTTNNLTENTTVKESIVGRVPEHEPYGGHIENEEKLAVQAPGKRGETTGQDIDLTNISGTVSQGQVQVAPPRNVNSQLNKSGLGSESASNSTNVNPSTGRPWRL